MNQPLTPKHIDRILDLVDQHIKSKERIAWFIVVMTISVIGSVTIGVVLYGR